MIESPAKCKMLSVHKSKACESHLKLEAIKTQQANQYTQMSEVDITILTFYLTE